MTVEGLFRLGVITSMQSDVLPVALRTLRSRHPLLNVRIPPLNDSDELLTELRAGRIDAALLVRPDNGGLHSDGLARGCVQQPSVAAALSQRCHRDLDTLQDSSRASRLSD